MAQNLFYVLILLYIQFITFSYQSNENNEGLSAGENFVKEVIKSIRPFLTKVSIANKNEFETGPQEFGNFKGYVENVTIDGLDRFDITVFNVSGLTINNITFLFEELIIKSKYNLNGSLTFPLGRTDIHVFGNGKLSIKIKNLRFSLKLDMLFENKIKTIKNLDLYLDYEKMMVHLSNLMKSKELEKVFNKFICDINKTIFEYYRSTILNYIKDEVKNIILHILNSNSLVKDEL